VSRGVTGKQATLALFVHFVSCEVFGFLHIFTMRQCDNAIAANRHAMQMQMHLLLCALCRVYRNVAIPEGFAR
jgi:hypothetical protein